MIGWPWKAKGRDTMAEQKTNAPSKTIAGESASAIIRVDIPFVTEGATGVFGHVLTGDRRARESYLDALEREVEAVAADADDLSIRAIRIDGPMPSIMSPGRPGRLAHGIKGAFCCELGCETTLVALPHTIGVPSLTGWQGAINRVELLVDSLEPPELIALNRPFDAVCIQNALLFFDKFHLNNVGVRIVVGIPGQTTPSLMRTLRSLADVDVAHFRLVPLGEVQPDGDDGAARGEMAELLGRARERLVSYGYEEYLPLMFARKEAQRDRFAWAHAAAAPEIGLGIDAVSAYHDLVYVNTSDFNTYVENSADPSKTVSAVAKL